MTWFVAEGVAVEFERIEGAPEATRDVLNSLSELNERLIALDEAAEAGEPKLAAHLAEARANLILAASAVLSSVDYKCTLDTPPEDIRARPGPSGNMVHRCFHDPSHCWDGSWNLISCPSP